MKTCTHKGTQEGDKVVLCSCGAVRATLVYTGAVIPAMGIVDLCIAATANIASWLPVAILATGAAVYFGLIVKDYGGVRSSAKRLWSYLLHGPAKS